MQRELSTRRLLLRPPRAGDAALAHARWAADPVVWRYLDGHPHADVAETRRQLGWDEARWLKRSAWTWLLLPHHDAGPSSQTGPIGMVQLVPQQLQGSAHHLRLGFLLAPAWQRQGFMVEALAAVLAHAFAQPQVWRVDALCDADNTASQRALTAAGLVCEGRLARIARHPNAGDAPRDAWLFAMTRSAGEAHDAAGTAPPV